MDRKIIVVGGDWQKWEWYALQRHTRGVAHIGFLLLPGNEERGDVFEQRLSERSCCPSSLGDDEDAAEWIKKQDILILSAHSQADHASWQERGVDKALRDFWMRGGVILAEWEAAGLLFSEGVDREGAVFRGLEFLQGSFCPGWEEHGGAYTRLVEEGEISSGWGAERWSGLHFRGRHLWRALQLDETSAVWRVRESGQEKMEDVTLIPY